MIKFFFLDAEKVANVAKLTFNGPFIQFFFKVGKFAVLVTDGFPPTKNIRNDVVEVVASAFGVGRNQKDLIKTFTSFSPFFSIPASKKKHTKLKEKYHHVNYYDWFSDHHSVFYCCYFTDTRW